MRTSSFPRRAHEPTAARGRAAGRLLTFLVALVLLLAAAGCGESDDPEYQVNMGSGLLAVEDLDDMRDLTELEIVDMPDTVAGFPLAQVRAWTAVSPQSIAFRYDDPDGDGRLTVRQSLTEELPARGDSEIFGDTPVRVRHSEDEGMGLSWIGCDRLFTVSGYPPHVDAARQATAELIEHCPGISAEGVYHARDALVTPRILR